VRTGNRYVWDSRPGFYFLDWRDGKKRLRELAGQRRKRNELIGEAVAQGKALPESTAQRADLTLITDAAKMHLEHVKAHSPNKPRTLSRYRKVLEHFERILGSRRYVAVITRSGAALNLVSNIGGKLPLERSISRLAYSEPFSIS
jgi:hypothetical protein